MKFNTSNHAKNQGMEFSINRAIIKDVESLLFVERACFSAPWSLKHFEAELEGNQFSHIYVVPHTQPGADSPTLIGYICAWIIFEEVRFLNVAVMPEFRRRGIAHRLIVEILELAIQEKCCRGMLEVRESNDAAIKLYKSLNFKEYAKRKSYYTNPTEDAILMSLEPVLIAGYHE